MTPTKTSVVTIKSVIEDDVGEEAHEGILIFFVIMVNWS